MATVLSAMAFVTDLGFDQTGIWASPADVLDEVAKQVHRLDLNYVEDFKITVKALQGDALRRKWAYLVASDLYGD